uniref:DUF7041 domain-containing protein n=1 Tax=Panagrolaimus superbus TaxID=310955 RepID=A0A914Z822_9BILA
MVRSPPSPAVAVPVMDAAGFAAAVAAAVAQLQINNPATANVSQNLPSIPKFICDPAKPNGASLWFDQLDSLFRLQPVTDTEKCALVINALDSSTFEKVSRALLPDPIKTCVDYNKLRDKMIGLFEYGMERS